MRMARASPSPASAPARAALLLVHPLAGVVGASLARVDRAVVVPELPVARLHAQAVERAFALELAVLEPLTVGADVAATLGVALRGHLAVVVPGLHLAL